MLTKKEKKHIINRRYIENNRETINQRKRQWIEDNYEKSMFKSLRTRCKLEHIDFELDESDIVIPKLCSYLKVPLTKIQHQGRVWSNASIDRIDNTKGYIKGNIEIISMRANAMKQAATKSELIQLAKSVLDKFDNPYITLSGSVEKRITLTDKVVKQVVDSMEKK